MLHVESLRRWPRIGAAIAVGLVVAAAITSWVIQRPHAEFVTADGVITYEESVAAECWDLYLWRAVVWDRIGSGNWGAVSSGAWEPARGILEGRSCNAAAVIAEEPQFLQARLPADAAPGVYRLCQWDDCIEFEYRPQP